MSTDREYALEVARDARNRWTTALLANGMTDREVVKEARQMLLDAMDLVEQTREERPLCDAYAIVDEWLKQNDPPDGGE